MMIGDTLRANLHTRIGTLSQHFELQTKHEVFVAALGTQKLVSRNPGIESTSHDGALLKSEGPPCGTFPTVETPSIKQINPLRSTDRDCEAEQSHGYSQRHGFPPTSRFYECEMHWRFLREEIVATTTLDE